MKQHFLPLAASVVLLASVPTWARNIDLVTLPPREIVQLTIYNWLCFTLAEHRSGGVKRKTFL